MSLLDAMNANDSARQALQKHAEPDRVAVLQRYFRNRDDVFLGVRVPAVRKLSKTFPLPDIKDIAELLSSKIHEERLLALFFLARMYRKADQQLQNEIYGLYLESTRYINNWDLVDCSAEHIVGAFLSNKTKTPLYRLARSKDLWERRIAILSTFHYIKKGECSETLKIANILLNDPEDLIHKAVGWMLREVGKRNPKAEKEFLRKHHHTMPRTMLRYAIEKFPTAMRQFYLTKGKRG